MDKLEKKLDDFIQDESKNLTMDIIKSFKKYINYYKNMKGHTWCDGNYIHILEDKIYHRFILNTAFDKFTKKEMKEIAIELMNIKEIIDNINVREYDCY